MTRSRWLIGAGGFLLVLLLLAATCPWWLGAALRGSASRFGATFQAYETHGYGRFVLRDVEVRRGNVVVSARSIEADTPVLWAWRRLRLAPGIVSAGEWSVVVAKQEAPRANPASGWLLVRSVLWKIAGELDDWLPRAAIGPGSVRWPGGELRIGSGRWDRSTLTVKELRYNVLAADATLAFVEADDDIRIIAEDSAHGVTCRFDSRGTQVIGAVTALDQRASIVARFAATGWIPPEATLIADGIRIPAERLKLGPAYATVEGHARVEWRTDHFFADVGLRGVPGSRGVAPPLSVAFRGRGDPQLFTLEAFRAELPGAFADLSEPVSIERSGRIRQTAARLVFNVDLSRQPWFPAKGVVAGQARVVNGSEAVPLVQFDANAADLTIAGTAVGRSEVHGRFEYPRLVLESAVFEGSADEVVRATGGWDLRSREVLDAHVEGTLHLATLGRWLPRGLHLESARFDATASGPATALRHAGRLQVSHFQYTGMNSSEISATWRGTGAAIDTFAAEAAFGETKVSASGSADMASVQLLALSIKEGGIASLRLAAPARLAWRPSLTLENLRLQGPGASIDGSLSWGTSGRVALAVAGVPSRWLARFIPLKGPAWSINSFALTGDWSHGPMTYSCAGGFAAELAEGRMAELNLSARGDAGGMQIDALHATESGNAVVNATGRIPVRFSPGNGSLVSVDPNGNLALQATTVPNAAFWQQLAAMTGVELRAPSLKADVSGTWSRPRGQLTLVAERAAMDPGRFARPLPSVESLDLACIAEPYGITLDRLTFAIERQVVRISGRLPLEGGWRDLLDQPMRVAERSARLRIEVPDAEVAMFSKFLPAALAPAGRLQADLRVDGGALGGFVRLRDAASRPLGPLGVLQDVNADVEFAGRRIILQRVAARTGGQPVTVSGSVELPSSDWLAGRATEPVYDIAVRGENVPFVRQPALLLRGDVDVRLRTPQSGVPKITGKVVLRDSLFLADLRAYLPRGSSPSPSRRPPYFSVDIEPLNSWELDVEITGSRFMRVRLPVFAGVTSARFSLRGTLGAPRAVGDATIDEGQVLMPFATFAVTQGFVRLTEEDPYEPAIFVRGAGRHWGYDLAMEVSGKASAPNITFTSSPALSSDQVLLMVMTGAAPTDELNTSLTHRAVQIGAFFGQSMLGSLTGNPERPNRLTVESGEKISRQGRDTYSIEYDLADRWALTGEYDEFDEYNVGLKWRLAPKVKER